MTQLTPEQLQAIAAAGQVQQAPQPAYQQPYPPYPQPQPYPYGYPPAQSGVNINVLVILVAFMLMAGMFFYFSQKQSVGPNPAPQPVPASTLEQQLSSIFTGPSAAADKLYLGYLMNGVADRLQADTTSQPPSFQTINEIRGPLIGEVSRFAYLPRLKGSLSHDQAVQLQTLLSTKLDVQGKGADPLTSQARDGIVAACRDIARAAGAAK